MTFVYIIQNTKSGRIYVGFSNDLRRRMKEHWKKKGKDWALIYYEAYRSSRDAEEREEKLKHYGTSLANLKRRIKYSFVE